MSNAIWPPEAAGGSSVSVLSDLSDVSITSVQDQDRLEYDIGVGEWVNKRSYSLDTLEPTGVIDTTETTLSVSVTAGLGGTATITRVGSDFSHYIAGKKYTQSADKDFTIPATSGLYFCYYTTGNAPLITNSPWDLLTDVPYMIVYYNDDTGDYFLGEERHGISMSGATHKRLHLGVGAVYYTGFGISGYVLNSDTLADVQIAIESGSFGDEDITLDLLQKAEGDNWDKWYREGASGPWRKTASTDTIPAFHASNIPKINVDTGGGTWALQNVNANYYFNSYILATNSYESTNRFCLIPGQQAYLTSLASEQESLNSLSLGDLPTPEMIPIYKIRMQYKNSYTGNNARIEIIEVEDLRGTSNPGIAATGLTHNSLGGRSDTDCHPASAISMPLGSGSPTSLTSLEDWYGVQQSSGLVSGLAITSTTPATPQVTLSGGDVYLRSSDSKTAEIKLYTITGQSINIASDDISYLYADYNGGSPNMNTTTDITTIGAQSTVITAVAAAFNGNVHYFNIGDYTIDFMADYARMRAVTNWLEHGSGAKIGETGTRNITLTAGSFYVINTRFVTAAFDTSAADTFDYFYRDGVGGWTAVTAQTQINNTQYDDNSGSLATLDNNKYAVHWVWLLVNNPDVIHVLYPQAQYNTLAEARAEGVPTDIPPQLESYGPAVLVGKIIIQKNASSFSVVASPFDTVFTSSTATTHNSLSSIQGGTLNEYYHLTSAQHTNLTGGNPTFTSVTTESIDSAGATLNIGATTATTINIGRAGQTVNILGATNNINATNVNVPNDLDVDGLITADGGIDRSSAATLELGVTNANAVSISRTGITTTVKGDFVVDESAIIGPATGGSLTHEFQVGVSNHQVYIRSGDDITSSFPSDSTDRGVALVLSRPSDGSDDVNFIASYITAAKDNMLYHSRSDQVWMANNSEIGRATETGAWIFGTTTAGSHVIRGLDNGKVLTIENHRTGASDADGVLIDFTASAPNNLTQYFLRCVDSSATRFTLYSNGGMDADGRCNLGPTTPSSNLYHSIRGYADGSDGVLFVRDYNTTLAYPVARIITSAVTDSTSNKLVNFNRNVSTPAGAIVCDGSGGVTFGTYSDARLKHNFRPYNCLQSICDLKIGLYDLKHGSKNCIGTTAQKMEKVFPECVSIDESTKEKYMQIAGWGQTEYKLARALQELNDKHEKLKEEFDNLKKVA